MLNHNLCLTLLKYELSVVRLPVTDNALTVALLSEPCEFINICRTPDELSLVLQSTMLKDVKGQSGSIIDDSWRAFKVEPPSSGNIELSMRLSYYFFLTRFSSDRCPCSTFCRTKRCRRAVVRNQHLQYRLYSR